MLDLSLLNKAVESLESPIAEMHFIGKDPSRDSYSVSKVNIGKEVPEEALKVVRDKVAMLSRDPDLTTKEYDPVFSEEGAIEYIGPIDEKFSDALNSILNGENESFEKVTPKFLREVKACAVKFTEHGQTPIVVFTKYTKSKIIKNKSAWLWEEGMLRHLKGEVFAINYEPDCIYSGGYLYIFGKRAFEDIFGYMDKIKSVAEEKMQELAESSLLSVGDGIFEGFLSHRGRLRAFSQVTLGRLDKLSLEICHRMKDEFGLSFEISDDKVVINSVDSLRHFVSVLNDNWLRSPFTENKYEAKMKTPLQNNV